VLPRAISLSGGVSRRDAAAAGTPRRAHHFKWEWRITRERVQIARPDRSGSLMAAFRAAGAAVDNVARVSALTPAVTMTQNRRALTFWLRATEDSQQMPPGGPIATPASAARFAFCENRCLGVYRLHASGYSLYLPGRSRESGRV
jgi:hypothetical protein